MHIRAASDKAAVVHCADGALLRRQAGTGGSARRGHGGFAPSKAVLAVVACQRCCKRRNEALSGMRGSITVKIILTVSAVCD